ncbi:MAG: hypothetical protein RIQ46_753 [Pseudomonadota bacterium]
MTLRRSLPLAFAAALAAGPASAYQVETGFDRIQAPDTAIHGLHRLYLGHDAGGGFSFGQAIYSAASGDAGGAFFWGYEAAQAWSLGDRLSIRANGFIGGGGGAGQVTGDGLILRLGLSLGYRITDTTTLTAGLARIGIDGGDGAATALSLGLAYGPAGAWSDAGRLRSIALRAGLADFGYAPGRSGSAQPDLALVGAEFALHGGPTGEWFIAAEGAARGAEGYMQVLGGLRQRAAFGALSAFAEGAAGFGGGGDVDTGGGALVQLGAGLGLALSPALDLEVALTRQWIPDTGQAATAATLRLARVFHRNADEAGTAQDWHLSTGLSQQFPNAGFRKSADAPNGKPLMQETSLDLMLTDATYLTGNAQTVLGGDAAGYAIGLLGLGRTISLSPRLDASVEALVGAAGGGGIATEGGAILGLRLELDTPLAPGLLANLAIGQYRTLQGDGMAPAFVTLGLKVPFRTE